MKYKQKTKIILTSSLIQTPLGDMIAVADMYGLYFLDFAYHKNADRKIERLASQLNALIEQGNNAILDLIEQELQAYFAGTLQKFTTPLHLIGSEFQRKSWNFLMTVPYGSVTNYAHEAVAIGNPKAVRAVANANGKNNLAIIVPCHRIIASTGKLCGYASGIERKEWLIRHERQDQMLQTD